MNALQLQALSFQDKAYKPPTTTTTTPKPIQKTVTPTVQPTEQPKKSGLDQEVVVLAKAIRQHETGNRQISGATGELASRYQFMPTTWKSEAKRILGDENAPLTLENENKVAYTRIKEWKDAGYDVGQIASMWNSGNPDMYAKGNRGVGQSSENPNVTYNVPKYVNSVYSLYKQEKSKIPKETTVTETPQETLPTEQTYYDKMKANSPLLSGIESTASGIGKGIGFVSEKILKPTVGRAVGSVVENLGTGIGGAVGLVAGTGKELYDVAKGDKFSFKDIGQAIESTAKATGEFGKEVGIEGGAAAPFAGLGKIPSAIVAIPSLYEGTKKMIQTKGQEGKTELAIGAAGLLGAKLSTGAWIDDPLKAMVKSGVNSPISKTAKITDDIRNGYRSVLRPGKGEIMNIEVRQGKSIDNIIDFIAEEGVVIKSTPDGKMDTLEAIDFLKQKQQEPNRVLNEILSTDKTKKFDLMESAEKAFKELEATVKNADELNARKKEVLEFIQAEIERNGRYVDATTLNNIKSGMWSVGYNMGKPTSQSTARKLGHIMKESIEQNFKDQNIRNLNNLTGQYADALYMLKQAEGRVVPKGAIGQYVAQAIGAMAGSSVPLVGPLAGGWIGGKVGKYLASPERVTSKLMQKAQQAGIPKRSETIMKESVDAATKAKLQPKLPPLLEAGKSQSGAIQLPPISDTGKALQSAKSYVTVVPAEVTTGRNVGTGQFKEVYKSTPKLPPKTIQSIDNSLSLSSGKNNYFSEEIKDFINTEELKYLKKTFDDGFLPQERLKNLLVDNKIIEKYPQLKDYDVVFDKTVKGGGSADVRKKIITVDPAYLGGYIPGLQNILKHEVQHAIDFIELGKTKGGSPNMFTEKFQAIRYAFNDIKKRAMKYPELVNLQELQELDYAVKQLDKGYRPPKYMMEKYVEPEKYNLYLRLEGEANARKVSFDKRKDIPENLLIKDIEDTPAFVKQNLNNPSVGKTVKTIEEPLIQEAKSQMKPYEIDFIKSKGVDIDNLKLSKKTATPKEIFDKLTPEMKKDVLSKIDRVSAEKSTSQPILIQGKNGFEIIDGGHSLAGKLKNNFPINYLIEKENPLINEAKKYKSADEFVKAQGETLYHGSPNASIIEKKGFDINADKSKSLSGGGSQYAEGINFTPSKKIASDYGTPVEVVLPSNLKLFEGDANTLIKQNSVAVRNKLIEKGYDGVSLGQGQGRLIIIFDPNKIKIKSQLIDIWNKANKGLPIKLTPNGAKLPPVNNKQIKSGSIYNLPETINFEGNLYRGHSSDEKIVDILPNQSWTTERAVADMFKDDKITTKKVNLKLYNTKDYANFADGIEKELVKKGYDGVITDISPDMGDDFIGVANEVRLFDKNEIKLPPSQPVYKESGNLTTKVLKDLEGKSTVSKQYILDATNRGELKQTERDLIRQILETEKGKDVDVVNFVNKVKTELLPLERKQMKNASKVNNVKYGERQRYESISLPNDLRGNVANYDEIIYESPVKTSAGKTHFDGGTDNYFGHTRIEDMAGASTGRYGTPTKGELWINGKGTEIIKDENKVRRVIEVQSDLYQKGNLEKEYKSLFDRMDRSEKIKLSKIDKQIDSIDIASKKFDEAHKQRNMYLKEIENKYKGEVDRLQQYNDPTAHFRMVREEVKQAAIDGKTKLQFPTGETAMKIEGLFQPSAFKIEDVNIPESRMMSDFKTLDDKNIKKGLEIFDRGRQKWIITDVLEDGKFKAVPKNAKQEAIEEFNFRQKISEGGDGSKFSDMSKKEQEEYLEEALHFSTEQFDISGKVDTNNPIYKFYEKDLGKYVTNKYGAKRIVDDKGVQWYEVDVKPEWAKMPVEAFGLGALGIGSQLIGGRKE